jgi:hypothetical protein
VFFCCSGVIVFDFSLISSAAKHSLPATLSVLLFWAKYKFLKTFYLFLAPNFPGKSGEKYTTCKLACLEISSTRLTCPQLSLSQSVKAKPEYTDVLFYHQT